MVTLKEINWLWKHMDEECATCGMRFGDHKYVTCKFGGTMFKFRRGRRPGIKRKRRTTHN